MIFSSKSVSQQGREALRNISLTCRGENVSKLLDNAAQLLWTVMPKQNDALPPANFITRISCNSRSRATCQMRRQTACGGGREKASLGTMRRQSLETTTTAIPISFQVAAVIVPHPPIATHAPSAPAGNSTGADNFPLFSPGTSAQCNCTSTIIIRQLLRSYLLFNVIMQPSQNRSRNALRLHALPVHYLN